MPYRFVTCADGFLLTWVAGYTPRWFTRPKMVTHRGSNRAQCSAATLIETNALPLSQTANKYINYKFFIISLNC